MKLARLHTTAGALLVALVCATSAMGAAERGPAWASLTVGQQQALAPLQRDWATIDSTRKQKWIAFAPKFHAMPADERQRVQQRMAEWARLTPGERTQARLQFQEARQLPAEERQAKWQAYQALSDAERQSLAQRALPTAKAASASESQAKARVAADAATGKSNLVMTRATAVSRAVAPIVVQAKPGATTTTMSVRNHPSAQNQPGLPKIATAAGYVDPTTLLPLRAAPGPASSSSPAESAEQP